MDEADALCEDVAFIDHGQLIERGTPAALKKEHKTQNLEDIFVKLVGHAMHAEDESSLVKGRDPFIEGSRT